jgi:hypothetical protein
MKKKVLIAHFNKDISWVNEIDRLINFEIYSTSHSEIDNIDKDKIYFIDINKGMDANMYLKFILNNYDNLPDKILFVHHHFSDWSQDFSLPFIINNLKWDSFDYVNVGKRECYQDLYKINNGNYRYIKDWFKDIWYLFDEYLKFPDDCLYYYAGTQFMVSKELILQYPKEFYQKLYNWLLDTNWEDYKSGRIFEYLWHYIITKNPIDKEISNNEIYNKL